MGMGVAMTFHDQGAGYMPWNWNQFYANWRYGTSSSNSGTTTWAACVHADGTPRRGGVVLRNWAALLDGVSFDQRANRQVVFVYPKTILRWRRHGGLLARPSPTTGCRFAP